MGSIKKYRVPLAFIFLGFLLGVLTAISVYFFQLTQDYYRRELAVRLDPLDLNRRRPSQVVGESLPTIVFLGDSRAEAWPNPNIAANFLNLGVSRQTTAQVLLRSKIELAKIKPSVIVIQVGVNDLKACSVIPDQKQGIIDQTKANLRSLVNVCEATGATVILTTIFPPGPSGFLDRTRWNDDSVSAILEVNRYIRSTFPDHFDSAKLLSSRESKVADGFASDLLHINGSGYIVLNAELEKVLRKVTLSPSPQMTTGSKVSP